MTEKGPAATIGVWQRLNAVLTDIAGGRDVELALHELADIVAPVVESPLVSVHIVLGTHVEVVAVAGAERVDDEVEGRRVSLEVWERLLTEPGAVEGPMLFPMRTTDGRLVGVIAAERPPEAPSVTDEQRDVVRLCAAQVAAAIDSQRTVQALRRDRERLRVREETLRLTTEDAPIGMCLVSLGASDRGRVVKVNRALCELFGYRDSDFYRLEVIELLDCADVAGELTELASSTGPRTVRRHECRCLRSDGTTFWALIHVTVLPAMPGEKPVLLAQVLDVTGRQENGREPARRAVCDPLTGLLNRTMVLERLDGVLASTPVPGRPGAILRCGLSQLTEFSATHGHVIADEVLLTVARRIAGVLRRSDTVGRIGADEFLAVVPEISEAGAQRLAERIRAAVAAPVSVRGQLHHVDVELEVVLLERNLSGEQIIDRLPTGGSDA